ncbi:MAG: hypothetical protein LBE83_07475 [Propionibacteriaceae bacterium]|jgi:hypothetical protein|nr:hypothetical protein [Propionibacteriaceae bacterium]
MLKKLPMLVLVLASALLLTACNTGSPDPTPPSEDTPSTPSGNNTWPDNEFTRMLPRPTMEIDLEPTIADGVFYAGFANMTVDDARAYGEQLMGMGFTESLSIKEYEDVDKVTTMYTMTAENSSGYKVSFTWAASTGVASLTLGK